MTRNKQSYSTPDRYEVYRDQRATIRHNQDERSVNDLLPLSNENCPDFQNGQDEKHLRKICSVDNVNIAKVINHNDLNKKKGTSKLDLPFDILFSDTVISNLAYSNLKYYFCENFTRNLV